MTDLASSDVLFVGSVPKPTAEDVFRLCAKSVGDRVFALPDGETGDRSMWVGGLVKATYLKHPHVESVPPEELPEIAQQVGGVRLKTGINKTTFDNLPYADAAISSYASFCRQRELGEIPEGVRFQVSLPTPFSGISVFSDPERWQIALAAFERGIRLQIEAILDHIDAADLAIQWDYCVELIDAIGAQADLGMIVPDENRAVDARIKQHTSPEYLAPLSRDIPDQVLVGYHLCYGTYGGWPMTRVEDLGLVVRMANAVVANTARRVDFLHLPVMENSDDAFFAPLQDLNVGASRVFLGLEVSDGVDALLRRASSAKKYLSDFGIAHYCGYGRDDPGDLPKLIDDLRVGAERISHGEFVA